MQSIQSNPHMTYRVVCFFRGGQSCLLRHTTEENRTCNQQMFRVYAWRITIRINRLSKWLSINFLLIDDNCLLIDRSSWNDSVTNSWIWPTHSLCSRQKFVLREAPLLSLQDVAELVKKPQRWHQRWRVALRWWQLWMLLVGMPPQWFKVLKTGSQRVCSNYQGIKLLIPSEKAYASTLEKRFKLLIWQFSITDFHSLVSIQPVKLQQRSVCLY